ncbi:amidohydrolase family protein [Coraliomargarita parva]|uniref:amidohydrolase family protein n=1 Tax=Coraliomargarita parva TaxID=3014050 RepID=UPI0022B40743|nr:amidohydrolase family protein [Coraliomargarita parva]
MQNASLLIHNLDYLVTMDADRRILQDAWVWIEDGDIKALGEGKLPEAIPEDLSRLDGKGKIGTPGLVNCHHHFYQNMARAYTPGNNLPLLPWLAAMNKLWQPFREDDLALCTELGLVELMLSGATTVADHHYVFPDGAVNMIDAQFEAASRMGVRFHASRGSMNVKSDLISDWALQEEAEILDDTVRLIETHHDAGHGSWRQIIVAPCAATSCSESLLKASAELAKKYKVGLHTHCGETVPENEFSMEKFGRRPLAYLLDCGWDYDRTWLAHGIHFEDTELDQLQSIGIGVAHCPNANMRLGSGICRVPEFIERGIKVGIAVDGSASNDSGHILGELRQALYLARVRYGAEAMSVLDALEVGTWRAAEMMGRNDIGRIATGLCGDLALFPVEDLYANGCENPVDALLICHPRQVSDLVVGGNVRVCDGEVIGLDLEELMARHQDRADVIHAGVAY